MTVRDEARALARYGRAKAIREARGLTTRDLADLVSTSSANVSRWETGLFAPRDPALARRWVATLHLLGRGVGT